MVVPSSSSAPPPASLVVVVSTQSVVVSTIGVFYLTCCRGGVVGRVVETILLELLLCFLQCLAATWNKDWLCVGVGRLKSNTIPFIRFNVVIGGIVRSSSVVVLGVL